MTKEEFKKIINDNQIHVFKTEEGYLDGNVIIHWPLGDHNNISVSSIDLFYKMYVK